MFIADCVHVPRISLTGRTSGVLLMSAGEQNVWLHFAAVVCNTGFRADMFHRSGYLTAH